MENILVAGAHGTTGKKIINLLKESQYFNPIAMVRDPAQIPFFEAKQVDTVLADLEKDISAAFNQPIDKVVFAAGSGGKKVEAVDQEGAKKLINASEKNNVKKFIMLSSMGAGNPEAAEQLKDYLKAKHNADMHLKNSQLNFAIVRPGALTNGPLKNSIELKKQLYKQGSISRNDVAQTLVSCLHDDVANHATFEIIEGNTPISKALNTL
ncbi:SDR family oxidoreductase [Bizionia sediminis]|uniref:SDR family oxidoreductase n=1 Tax=Bizionia sediminis TaxID=1737064 RepID=A0ABW5KRU1_9FLAO